MTAVVWYCFVLLARSFLTVKSHGTDAVAAETPFPAVITLAADATPPERHAASDLARILRQITNGQREFAVTAPSKQLLRKPQIAVGYSAALALGVPASAVSGLGLEGFVALSAGAPPVNFSIPTGSVCLTGGRGAPRGTLYATNFFLHKIGVRFLAQDTTVLPDRLPTVLPPLLRQPFSPRFEYRQQYDYALEQKTNASLDLNVHLGLNKGQLGGVYNSTLDAAHGGAVIYADDPGFVHTSFRLVPPAQYNQSHPSWFATNQLCWKAKGLKEFLARRVAELLRQQPNATIISVSQNDGGGY